MLIWIRELAKSCQRTSTNLRSFCQIWPPTLLEAFLLLGLCHDSWHVGPSPGEPRGTILVRPPLCPADLASCVHAKPACVACGKAWKLPNFERFWKMIVHEWHVSIRIPHVTCLFSTIACWWCVTFKKREGASSTAAGITEIRLPVRKTSRLLLMLLVAMELLWKLFRAALPQFA